MTPPAPHLEPFRAADSRAERMRKMAAVQAAVDRYQYALCDADQAEADALAAEFERAGVNIDGAGGWLAEVVE